MSNSPSAFTLTFAVEILGIDIWHDCNEGWIDLGPCAQGLKLQYQLYPGQNFDVDILIWPHVAKIWCGSNFGWVRTWQLLERRFLTFSIQHIFPVSVADMRFVTATITPYIGLGSLGSTAKNDKNFEVFLPALKFGEQRYFAPVVDGEVPLQVFVTNLIWEEVAKFIPISITDGLYDVPGPVTDVRHQDTVLFYVKESILNKGKEKEEDIVIKLEEPKETKLKDGKDPKGAKDKEKDKKKVPDASKVKFEITLSGCSILAGVGRIVPFESSGERPQDLGQIIAIISSTNLPAYDDHPIIFVNVETLFDVPSEYLKSLSISKLYTKWFIGMEEHNSELFDVNSKKTEINFNDHYAIIMDPGTVSEITATFLDVPFEIQLRGIRSAPQKDRPQFFGYKKGDQSFGTSLCKLGKIDSDFLIAVTQINAKSMSKGMNVFIREECPLFPPKIRFEKLEREKLCTNDVNRIKAQTNGNIIVPVHVILQSQMLLSVSMGFVGCRPKKLAQSFARLFCIVEDSSIVMTIISAISGINDLAILSASKDDALTGFALDVGNLVVFYVEGPSNGEILKIWEMMQDFYPRVKPVYSSSCRYASRLYPELYTTMGVPFNVLKMFAPLAVILACPPVYARPALPVPTRAALLKLGLLIAGKFKVVPTRSQMPTTSEMKSFRLELCVAPKPALLMQIDGTPEKDKKLGHQMPTSQKINWDKQDAKNVGNEEKR